LQTMKQVRASEEEICKAIRDLTEGTETWQDVAMRLPAFERQEVDKINPASELCIIHVPCG
jgi:glycyl-tRNA synthetase